jgi:hypothetical protein
MAYSTPRTWAYGDTVPHTDMQKYSDGLNALYDAIPQEKISWGIGYSNMEDTQSFYVVHKARWLIYKSTGVIRHPTEPDIYPDVSLSDTGGICAFDVDAGVDWIVVGTLYQVVGCSVAFEDTDGIIV